VRVPENRLIGWVRQRAAGDVYPRTTDMQFGLVAIVDRPSGVTSPVSLFVHCAISSSSVSYARRPLRPSSSRTVDFPAPEVPVTKISAIAGDDRGFRPAGVGGIR
jgi:hypothetical protein